MVRPIAAVNGHVAHDGQSPLIEPGCRLPKVIISGRIAPALEPIASGIRVL